MEHVSPTSSSSTLAGGNPFLEDVVKPFLDYGTSSRSSEKKTSSERRKGGNNPFQPAERERAGSDVGSSHVLKEGRGKSEEAETGFSLGGRQSELSSATVHPSDRVGGEMEPLSIDSGVELQFNALLQEPEVTLCGNQTTPQEGKETKRLPPKPPARTTSLTKAASPINTVEAPKQLLINEDKEDSRNIQPLCLSEAKRFAVDYEVEESTDESLEDSEITKACEPEATAQDTSDFDDDDLSESDEKAEETFDVIPVPAVTGHSEEISDESPNGLEDVSDADTVGNDRDSAQFACTHRISRDPTEPDSEAGFHPGESAAAVERRLSADTRSSPASQHSSVQQTCHADDGQSKRRSRSQLRPEEASEFINEEEMRIDMQQPVYSGAYQVT